MVISVIITNYNYGNYIGRCIRSLVDQSMPKSQYEIIVVDDASTDHSKKVLETFSGLIRPVFCEQNVGVGAACNIGLRMALGRYVVRVDADDYVHHDFLLVSNLYLSQNSADCDAVAVDYVEVDEQENILGRKNCLEAPIACGVTYKLDSLTKVGLYNDNLRINEDIDLQQRFLSMGMKLHRLQIPLYRYKKHPQSMTATKPSSVASDLRL